MWFPCHPSSWFFNFACLLLACFLLAYFFPVLSFSTISLAACFVLIKLISCHLASAGSLLAYFSLRRVRSISAPVLDEDCIFQELHALQNSAYSAPDLEEFEQKMKGQIALLFPKVVFLSNMVMENLAGLIYIPNRHVSPRKTFDAMVRKAANVLFCLDPHRFWEVRFFLAMVHVPLVGKPSALSPCNHYAVLLLDLQSNALMLGEGLKASVNSPEMRNYAAILRMLAERIVANAETLTWDDYLRLRTNLFGDIDLSPAKAITRFPFPPQGEDTYNCGIVADFIVGEVLQRLAVLDSSCGDILASSPVMNFQDCFSFSKSNCMALRHFMAIELYIAQRTPDHCTPCACLPGTNHHRRNEKRAKSRQLALETNRTSAAAAATLVSVPQAGFGAAPAPRPSAPALGAAPAPRPSAPALVAAPALSSSVPALGPRVYGPAPRTSAPTLGAAPGLTSSVPGPGLSGYALASASASAPRVSALANCPRLAGLITSSDDQQTSGQEEDSMRTDTETKRRKSYYVRQQTFKSDPTPMSIRDSPDGKLLALSTRLSVEELWGRVRVTSAGQDRSYQHREEKGIFQAYCSKDVLPQHQSFLRSQLAAGGQQRALHCPFLVVATCASERKDGFVVQSKDGADKVPLVVRKSILGHFCIEASGHERQSAARPADVVRAVGHLLQVDPKISAKALNMAASNDLQESISNAMLKRVKKGILAGGGDKFAAGVDLQLLPAFLLRIAEADGAAKVVLWKGDEQKYLGWFIAPGCYVRAFATGEIRLVFTTDAAHCTGPEKGLLIGFHGYGPDNELITFAAAHVVQAESEAVWSWFLQRVCDAFQGLREKDIHLISDGDKGLANAVVLWLPRAYHALCCYHRSIKVSCPGRTKALFLKMAGAYTYPQFIACLAELQAAADSDSFETVDAVPLNAYCLAHMPTTEAEARQHWDECIFESCQFSSHCYVASSAPFDAAVPFNMDDILEMVSCRHLPAPFGRTASQGAESYAAKMLKLQGGRGGSAFQMASACFHDMLSTFAAMRTTYARLAVTDADVSSFVATYLKDRKTDLNKYNVCSFDDVPSSAGLAAQQIVGSVQSVSTKETHAVTLVPSQRRCECTCRTPSLRGLPCVHSYKLARAAKVPVNQLVHRSFTTEAGHLAFATPAQSVPVATADLVPATGEDALLPPENVPQRGRPSVKRKRGKFEDGKSARRPVRCSSCRVTGHTKRSCTAK